MKRILMLSCRAFLSEAKNDEEAAKKNKFTLYFSVIDCQISRIGEYLYDFCRSYSAMPAEGDIALEGLINPDGGSPSTRLYSISTLLRKRSPQEKWEYAEEGTPLLRRVLTWIDVLSCSSCMTIGAGIFVVAGMTAHTYTGPAVILSFMWAGFTALISSFCYGEFSARIPVAGSTYSFVYISLGEFAGWMAGWISIIEYTIGAAIAKEIAELCFRIATLLNPDFLESKPNLDIANHVISTLLISALAFLLLIGGVKTSAMFCRVMSVLNIATIVFIICSSVAFIDTNNWSDFLPFGFSGVVEGAGRVLFAYVGFENSTSLATEVKNPKKSMPLGVIGSLCIAIVLYISSSFVITGMVNYKDIVTKTPFVDAFSDHDAFWIAAIVALGSLLCMTTTILSSLLGLPRVLYQMAKDGLLWDIFARLNRFRMPYLGTILIAILSCLLTILLNFNYLTDMICCGVLINYTLIDFGVIALRFMDSECRMERRHYVLVICTIIKVLFGISMDWPYAYFPAISLIPFIICMILMYFMMPVAQLSRPPNIDSFLCPCVPILPCVGVLFNVAMIIQLQFWPLLQVVVWLLIGSGVYFGYGIRNSKLNFTNPNDQFYY